MSETLASGKVAWGNPYTEGSQTAKSGTDEQERDMRHSSPGKQAHHCNAQRIQKGQLCRSRRHWSKEKALTRGGLLLSSTVEEVSRGHSS
ncbi:MAG TPA: hypothetical protein VER35_01130 [Candidatus Limnocylindrales bacterium]|nr:hypothetical protein [Candidatus Limnocylindrales bacterium]